MEAKKRVKKTVRKRAGSAAVPRMIAGSVSRLRAILATGSKTTFVVAVQQPLGDVENT